jgi:hypothetical protein
VESGRAKAELRVSFAFARKAVINLADLPTPLGRHQHHLHSRWTARNLMGKSHAGELKLIIGLDFPALWVCLLVALAITVFAVLTICHLLVSFPTTTVFPPLSRL